MDRTLDRINVKYFKYACPDLGKETDVDISARCILCGDSQKNERQKRLHLYTKSSYDGDMVKCFNCEWTGNMFSFLREADSSLYEQYRKEKRELSFNNLKEKHDEKKEYNDAAITLGTYSKKVRTEERAGPSPDEDRPDQDGSDRGSSEEDNSSDGHPLGKIPDGVFELPDEFEHASENTKATNYLRNRGLDERNYYFSKDWIKLKGKDIPVKNCIIVPLWVIEDERIVYGFQARSIESKFFYTYIPEENTGFKVWNWYGLDKSKPTFIFESVFDAESSGLPLNMVCAALGADLNDERISELEEAIFCLDNQIHDLTSREKTIKLLKKGFRCFVWDKSMEYKDTNDAIRGDYTKKTMAKYILSHLERGMTGIMKVRLKR